MSDAPEPATRRPTKAGHVQRLLARPEGATLADLRAATGWQPHTVRAALTRLRQAGLAIERSRSDAGRTVYRILPVHDGIGLTTSDARPTAPSEAPAP
ncbi:DUF3489 domain-containing protein [Rubellimicrobium mesophilum]|uniref:DUF3489 domain-containing protein n=1 Tax=Rubellimicrobium mesophilum TaxID=1123067 RepID=UPI00146FD9FB